MKTLLISAMLISSALTPAYSADLFSAAQRKDVLTEIDNICGDTWCEGDYDFSFNKFTCDKATFICELSFQFIKTEDSVTDEEGKKTFSPEQVCRFENIKTFNQLKDSKWSLNDEFYGKLTDCIWEKEKAVKF